MHAQGLFRRLIFPLLLLFLISFVGVEGYRMIEGYSLVDAVYMTTITMSTVGFGTLGELSVAGKIFSILLIIFSTGTFVYVITNLTTFMVEGEMKKVLDRYKVNKRVTKLENHIIICGLGRNGREAALELLRQRQPFVVVETDESVIEDFRQQHDVLVVQGDATQEEVLLRANIMHAKGLVSSLSTDAENVYITLTARGLNPRLNIIARATLESSINKLKRAGANEVIVPNLIGGRKMANLLTRPALMEFVDLVSGEGNSHLHLEDIICANAPKLLGKTLRELEIRSQSGVLVLGFKRGNRPVELNPHIEDHITAEDRLFVMGTDAQLSRFRALYLPS